jgi:acyl-CoA synthetase (AMP-forming)/AMP-acid ligase II
MSSLDQLCQDALASEPDRAALEFEGQWIDWGTLAELAAKQDTALEASGAGNGTVAFVARNRPSAIAAFIGLLARGCPIRMVYPFQSAESLAVDLERIRPAVVVADRDDFSEPVTRMLAASGSAAIALDDHGASVLLAVSGSARSAEPAHAEPAVQILTSGTTGTPKPVPLSYDFIAREIVAKSQLPPELRGDGQDLPPALLMFPVSNISGLYSTLPPLLSGQRVVLLERFTVEAWHHFVLRFKPAVSGMPPAGVQMVLDADIPPQDLSSLKALGTGAAPLDPGVQRAFEERYGIPILLSYGATEFAGPVARMTPDLIAEWGASKHGSVGRALPGAKLRVVDPDSGEELPPNEQGLLEVITERKGPDWIRTSDLARIDEDGFLFLLGRADGAIMRGGFKLLPATIEHALLQHPSVSHTAVIGLTDRRLGEVPAAAIECRPGAPVPTTAELEKHLRDRLPATHIPTHWRIVDSLPRTPSVKIDLPAVRNLFAADG